MLSLEAVEYRGPGRWRWRLTTDRGAFLADHEVRLDTSSWAYEAFVDLERCLRVDVDPERPLDSEREVVDLLAHWVGSQVFGDVGRALLEQAPTCAMVTLPEGAEALLDLPLELAAVDGQPLALSEVSFVYGLGPARRRGKDPVRERLRILAVFSSPVEQSPLGLRRERRMLTSLAHRVATTRHRALHVDVLQYGVSDQVLRDALAEGEGWDLIHVSGHGCAGHLVLETAEGRAHTLGSEEFVDLLRLARRRVKLVTLSACESGAAQAARALAQLGFLHDGDPDAVGVVSAPPVGSLAATVARALDCAVVAMRYPVDDRFATEFAARLYEALLDKGRRLPDAVQLALPDAVAVPGVPARSVAIPVLFGASGAELSMTPPPADEPSFSLHDRVLAGVPDERERFVGRVGPLARAGVVLEFGSGFSGLAFHGMAGAGKTSCALELVYRHAHRFQAVVWHDVRGEDHYALRDSLQQFARKLEDCLPGLALVHLVHARDQLARVRPRLTQVMEEQRALIVLDNAESLLTDEGAWRDERWGELLHALVDHSGASRLVVTSRVRPSGLTSTGRVVCEPVHTLSLAESVLLARELPNLDGLLASAVAQDRLLALRALRLTQGHPKLLEIADGLAADRATFEARLADTERTWEVDPGTLDRFFAEDESALGGDAVWPVLRDWTRAAIATLDPAARTLLEMLCAMEEPDRDERLQPSWPDIFTCLAVPQHTSRLSELVGRVAASGLVELEQRLDEPLRYRIHPAVASTVRKDAPPAVQTAVDQALAPLWVWNMYEALDRETAGGGPRVISAGLAAGPYLIRLGEWDMAATSYSKVLGRDPSRAAAAALLPTLERIAAVTGALDDQAVAATALTRVDPQRARLRLESLAAEAVTCGDFRVAFTVTGNLFNLLRNHGRYAEALAQAERLPTLGEQAGLGPWTMAGGQLLRLQILIDMGQVEQALPEVLALLDQVDALPDPPPNTEAAWEATPPWSVREGLLKLSYSAAMHLGQRQEALDFTGRLLSSQRERGASSLERAETMSIWCGGLLALDRYEEAERLLHECREAYENANDLDGLGHVYSQLAELASKRGWHKEALQLDARALRYGYEHSNPDKIATRHFHYAQTMSRGGGDSAEILAHQLARTLISRIIGSALYGGASLLSL